MKSETDRKFVLVKAISISKAKPTPRQADKKFSLLTKEMILHEATCTLTRQLEVLLDAILTIRSTSIQNKRNFFYVCNICHKKENKTIG
jgi:hypothetical protein